MEAKWGQGKSPISRHMSGRIDDKVFQSAIPMGVMRRVGSVRAGCDGGEKHARWTFHRNRCEKSRGVTFVHINYLAAHRL
jgi:hypothetical protein